MYTQDSTANKGRFNGLGLGGQVPSGSTSTHLPSSVGASQRDALPQAHVNPTRTPDVVREDVSAEDEYC